MEFHLIANIFPLMTGSELLSLTEDVRKNGLLFPLMLYEGKILDGRNRYQACVDAGVTPRFADYEGEDPVGFVVSSNLERRHLNESQRAMCAARLAEFKHGGDRRGEDAALRLDDAARALRISPRTLNHAIVVKREGTPELIAAVDRGQVAVSQAAHIARTAPDVQREAMKKVEAGVKPVEAMRQIRRDGIREAVKDLPAGQFRVLYADPPWEYADKRVKGGTGTGSPEEHYPSMSVEELKALTPKIDALTAPDSVLLCWATFPLLLNALEVVSSWGFTYKTAFVWRKDRGFTGYYHRAEGELLLVATRGSCLPEAEKRADQVFDHPRAGHSEKPEMVRQMIDEQWKSGPRLELFRRGAAPPGWEVWGPESGS